MLSANENTVERSSTQMYINTLSINWITTYMVKLLEVISYDKVIINEAEVDKPPTGLQYILGDDTFEFKGQMWQRVKPDGSPGRMAFKDEVNQLNDMWSELGTKFGNQGNAADYDNARTGNVNLDANAKMWSGSKEKGFLVKIGSHAFKFPDEKAATEFIEDFNRGSKPVRQTLLDNVADRQLGAGSRFMEGYRASGSTLGDFLEKNSTAKFILTNPLMKLALSIFEIAGWSTALLHSHVANCAYWQDLQAQGDLTQEEVDDLILSSQAALGAQISALCLTMFKGVRRIRMFLTMARTISNVWAGVMAGTGVGLPGAIAMLAARETAFFLVQWWLTRPANQRILAEWIAGFLDNIIARAITGGIAGVTGLALNSLSGALGEFDLGFDQLLRDGGWEYSASKDQKNPQIYASTEWAKLAFQNVIYPPQKVMAVPFIAVGDRRRLMQSKFSEMFNITFTQNTDNEQPGEIDLGSEANEKDGIEPQTATADPEVS